MDQPQRVHRVSDDGHQAVSVSDYWDKAAVNTSISFCVDTCLHYFGRAPQDWSFWVQGELHAHLVEDPSDGFPKRLPSSRLFNDAQLMPRKSIFSLPTASKPPVPSSILPASGVPRPRRRLTCEGQGAGEADQGDIVAVLLAAGVSKGEVGPVVDHRLHPQLQAVGRGLGHGAGKHSPAGQDAVPPSRGQEGRVAVCLGAASRTSPLRHRPPQRRGGHSLREAVGSCQHPVFGEQGPPTEVCSVVAETDLPWPPAQAGVLASHDAVYGQLPVATVCGRGRQGQWGMPGPLGVCEDTPQSGECERTRPWPEGSEGT